MSTANPYQHDFGALLAQHGPTSAAVGFSPDTHRKRLHRIASVLPDTGECSLLDIGCGYGALIRYLEEAKPHLRLSRYVALDAVPAMVAETVLYARSVAGIQQVTGQVVSDEDPLVPYWPSGWNSPCDYVIACGVLPCSATPEHARELLARAWACCSRVLVVNTLSTQADRRNPASRYFNPMTVLAWGRALTRWYQFDHSYLPHDMTMVLFKEPP